LHTLKLVELDELIDISALENLTKLKILEISYCSNIKDILVLNNLYNLNKLELSYFNNINNFSLGALITYKSLIYMIVL